MILTLAALTMATQTGDAARPVYFPADYTQPRLICDPMRPERRMAALNADEVGYYTRHLAAAQEPSLAPAGKRAGEAIRFTWLRSFHAPVTVRIETSGKTAKLIAREMSGRGGYDAGTVARTAERALTEAETSQLKALIKTSDLDSLPAKQCEQEVKLDGAHWLFEHAGPRTYRLVDRQSPVNGQVRALGLFMLGLTGWTYQNIY